MHGSAEESEEMDVLGLDSCVHVGVELHGRGVHAGILGLGHSGRLRCAPDQRAMVGLGT